MELHGYIEIDREKMKARFTVYGNGEKIAVCGERISTDKFTGKGCLKLDLEKTVSLTNEITINSAITHIPALLYYIPARYPNPYTWTDLFIVVDSPPSYQVNGLPLVHSTVLTATKRTVLEGKSIPQILISTQTLRKSCTYIGDMCNTTCNNVIEINDKISIFYAYPILGPTEYISWAKICEENGESWGSCIVRSSRIFKIKLCNELVLVNLREIIGYELHEEQLLAAKIRLLEPLAFIQQQDAILLASEYVSKGLSISELITVKRKEQQELLVEWQRTSKAYLSYTRRDRSHCTCTLTSPTTGRAKTILNTKEVDPLSPVIVSICP